MGRELRQVPPNWEHPVVERRSGRDGFQPMRNERFEDAAAAWKAKFAAWERGERPNYCDADDAKMEFWEWSGGPPEREYYRPWRDEEATWWQVWETVSEGTPVTPPFATKKELVDYLVANGDFWDQSRRKEGRTSIPCDPWSRKAAESFVHGAGWAPSLVVDSKGVRSGVEAMHDGGPG